MRCLKLVGLPAPILGLLQATREMALFQFKGKDGTCQYNRWDQWFIHPCQLL